MLWMHDWPFKKLITKSLNKDEKSFFYFSFFSFHVCGSDRIGSHLSSYTFIMHVMLTKAFEVGSSYFVLHGRHVNRDHCINRKWCCTLQHFAKKFPNLLLTFDLLLFWSVKVHATCKISPKQIFLKWACKNLVRLRAQLHYLWNKFFSCVWIFYYPYGASGSWF